METADSDAGSNPSKNNDIPAGNQLQIKWDSCWTPIMKPTYWLETAYTNETLAGNQS